MLNYTDMTLTIYNIKPVMLYCIYPEALTGLSPTLIPKILYAETCGVIPAVNEVS
jgi:hypothetical protein